LNLWSVLIGAREALFGISKRANDVLWVERANILTLGQTGCEASSKSSASKGDGGGDSKNSFLHDRVPVHFSRVNLPTLFIMAFFPEKFPFASKS
jgi:hypothetical protein